MMRLWGAAPMGAVPLQEEVGGTGELLLCEDRGRTDQLHDWEELPAVVKGPIPDGT